MKRKSNALIGCFVALLMCAAMTIQAQDRGGDRSRGERPRFDPAQMQARMLERFQEELKATDEEWEVLKPLVEDVMTKQREVGRSGFPGRGFGRRGGDRGRRPGGDEATANRGDRPERGGPPQGENPELEALQELLNADDAEPADIQAKLAAFRMSRKEKQAALQQARENLQKVLTVRQEALLVLMGILE